MSRRTLSLALLLAATLSCGTEPGEFQASTLVGVAKDYDLGGLLKGVPVAILELPTKTATTDSSAKFKFDQLTPNTSVRVVVTGTNYRETINPITLLGARTVNVSVFGASVAFVGIQYAAVGLTQTAGAGMVVARLEDDLGDPRVGIPLADITLLDQNQAPAGTGPYIFGAADQLDNTLFLTAEFGGRSRIAFLNVPPGNYTLRVVDGGNVELRPLQVRADGVTLVVR